MIISTEKRYNYSAQRQKILELLKSTGRHPTAAWLYEKLKDEFSNLSMGTVYRNLNILIEQGLITKREFGSTFDRFEANTEPHYHFICERCHRIIDLDIPVDQELNERVRSATPFNATRHQIEFFGICDQCSREESEEGR
ncbi:MAG: transcriptional repressor [Spirochaetota bacterium]|nr:transcriptional repressor [Spirochaetota bacterium]